MIYSNLILMYVFPLNKAELALLQISLMCFSSFNASQ